MQFDTCCRCHFVTQFVVFISIDQYAIDKPPILLDKQTFEVVDPGYTKLTSLEDQLTYVLENPIFLTANSKIYIIISFISR